MDETQVALCTVSKVIYWCLHIIDNNVEDSNEILAQYRHLESNCCRLYVKETSL